MCGATCSAGQRMRRRRRSPTRTPKPNIGVPTLFAYGTDDHCVLPDSSLPMRESFTGPYDRVAVKGVGHFPQREDPKALAKLAEKWLGGLR